MKKLLQSVALFSMMGVCSVVEASEKVVITLKLEHSTMNGSALKNTGETKTFVLDYDKCELQLVRGVSKGGHCVNGGYFWTDAGIGGYGITSIELVKTDEGYVFNDFMGGDWTLLSVWKSTQVSKIKG